MDETKEERRRRKAREATARWRDANPERVKQNTIIGHQRRKENWQAFLEYERKRYHANPGPKLAGQKAHRTANPGKIADYGKRHYAANKAMYVAKVAGRRARRLLATPPWADHSAIAAIYVEAKRLTAETGVPHEVDHIIPLRGKNVCGLHIAVNMQVITRADNRRKFTKVTTVGIQSRSSDRPGVQSAGAV